MPVEISDASFQSEVLEAKLPVLLDLWAPWCGPCRALAPVLEGLEQSLDGMLRVAKLNVDESSLVAAQLGVRGIPMLVLFHAGQALGSMVGAQPREAILAFIEQHLPHLGLSVMSPAEVEASSKAGEAVVVDVRPAFDYQRGHIPESLSIPSERFDQELLEALSALEAERVILVCRTGRLASQLARDGRGEGLEALAVVEDGILGWEVSGRRLVS